jgi:hypothetical protein
MRKEELTCFQLLATKEVVRAPLKSCGTLLNSGYLCSYKIVYSFGFKGPI